MQVNGSTGFVCVCDFLGDTPKTVVFLLVEGLM